ncbi:uncharacterized protein LOC143451904 [Clavelina lepadiformis]|uniref:uncharacterized protein LOC143451904 n=1 Tax=Clavelina lepadiformis TaxID=159417 RepID=UPI00404271D4
MIEYVLDAIPSDYSPLQTSMVVTPHGGSIKLGGCEISIPTDAVEDNKLLYFTLIYKDNGAEIPEQVRLTPTLRCSPASVFDKPVKITLPTCHLPNRRGVAVTPQLFHEIQWLPLDNVECHSNYSITFETSELTSARCIGNAQDFDEKRLLFKYYKDPDDEVTYPAIVWKVLDGDEYVDVEKDQQLFWLNIKKGQNVAIELTEATNTEFEREKVVIRSKEIFRQRTIIKRQFSVVDHDDTRGEIKDENFEFKLLNSATNEVLHVERFTFPSTPSLMVASKHDVYVMYA